MKSGILDRNGQFDGEDAQVKHLEPSARPDFKRTSELYMRNVILRNPKSVEFQLPVLILRAEKRSSQS
ncbi:MAG: hypothetical protein WBD36_07835 [Bacteroidota bacterium]